MPAQSLVPWALSQGATLHENVEVREDESGYSLRTCVDGYGITVEGENSTTREGTARTIVSCPLSLSLSAFNAFHECPLSRLKNQSDPARFPNAFLAKTPFHIVGKFFLCQQFLLSKDSFWSPYISALPLPNNANGGKKLDTPLFWTQDDLAWIRGTNMEFARQERLDSWTKEWQVGSNVLREADFHLWQSYTWDLYKWAATIFSSRCFTGSSLPLHTLYNKDTEDKAWFERVQKEHQSSQILFPLVDLANHDPKAKVTWCIENSSTDRLSHNGHASNSALPSNAIQLTDPIRAVESFKIVAESNIPPGQEVFNNYGSIKKNTELLQGYGFCLPDTENDHVAVDFKSQEWLKDARSAWERRGCYDPKPTLVGFEVTKFRYSFGWNTRSSAQKEETPEEFRTFEHGLLDILAIGMANGSEKSFIAGNPTHCLETARQDGLLARLLLAAIFVVYEKLRYDRERILKHGDLVFSGKPKTTAQHNAKIYRDGQLLILNHTITALEDRLKRAFSSSKHCITSVKERPTACLWTINDAYSLLSQWIEGEQFQELRPREIYRNARQTLELESHESLGGSEVLQEGYDSMLWILWLCVGSYIVSYSPAEIVNDEKFFVLQWIRSVEMKHPIHTNPPRSFSGDKQDLEMLQEILSSTQMAGKDTSLSDRISWASYIAMQYSIEAPRIWVRDQQGGEIVEMEEAQKILCVASGLIDSRAGGYESF